MSDKFATETEAGADHRMERLEWHLRLVSALGHLELPLAAAAAVVAATIDPIAFPLVAIAAVLITRAARLLVLRERDRLAGDLEGLGMRNPGLSEKIRKLTTGLTVGGPAS
jgi:hypothetical protein